MKKVISLIIIGILSNTMLAQVTDTGNFVGIGTTSPASKLDVRTSTNKGVRLNFNDESAITFVPNNGNSIFHLSHGHDNRLHISQGGTVGGGKLMTFVASGNVGIGTTSPGVYNTNTSHQVFNSDDIVFDVQGANNMGWVSVGSNISNGILGGIAFTKPNGQSDAHRQVAYMRVKTTQTSYNTPASTMEFATKGAGYIGDPDMIIDASGRVGIGTSNTFGYQLAVNGTIGSTEVKVENTSAWPDFVFENSYNLITLEEVEQHITKNGHLPEIPSEAEVAENGINLGEMDAKLLQKIEELTLYTIQQQKEIESLKRENKEVKSLNEKLLELQSRLEKLESEK